MRLKQLIIFAGITCSIYACKHKDDKQSTATNYKLVSSGKIPEKELMRMKNYCQNWYDTTLNNDGFCGGILVAQHGQIIFEKYRGTAHLGGKDTINANTPFHVASTSKTFTAMAVLKLWQDGKINLDDPFSKYFPTFNYPDVSIRTLLNHRSGLPNYVHFIDKLKWDKKRFVTNQDVLDLLINQKSKFDNIKKPNSEFSYSNTNYTLLALLIEKVSGISYPDFIRTQIFEPLHMDHSFVLTDKEIPKMNTSYEKDGKEFPFMFLDKTYGDKNIYTTPGDLLKWDRLLRTEEFLTHKTLEEAYKPYSNEKPSNKNYGLGWRMYQFPDGRKIIFHNGWWHGSNAAFVRLIEEDAVIIIIGNKFNKKIYNAKELLMAFNNNLDMKHASD